MAKTTVIRKAVPGSIAEQRLSRELVLQQFHNFVFAARVARNLGLYSAEKTWKAHAVEMFQKR